MSNPFSPQDQDSVFTLQEGTVGKWLESLRDVWNEPHVHFSILPEISHGREAKPRWKLDVSERNVELPSVALSLKGKNENPADYTFQLSLKVTGNGLGPQSCPELLLSEYKGVLEKALKSIRNNVIDPKDLDAREFRLNTIDRDAMTSWEYARTWDLGEVPIACIFPPKWTQATDGVRGPLSQRDDYAQVELELKLGHTSRFSPIPQSRPPKPGRYYHDFRTVDGQDFQETQVNRLPVQDGRWLAELHCEKDGWKLSGYSNTKIQGASGETAKVRISLEGKETDWPKDWLTLDEALKGFMRDSEWSAADVGTKVNTIPMRHPIGDHFMYGPQHEWEMENNTVKGTLTLENGPVVCECSQQGAEVVDHRAPDNVDDLSSKVDYGETDESAYDL